MLEHFEHFKCKGSALKIAVQQFYLLDSWCFTASFTPRMLDRKLLADLLEAAAWTLLPPFDDLVKCVTNDYGYSNSSEEYRNVKSWKGQELRPLCLFSERAGDKFWGKTRRRYVRKSLGVIQDFEYSTLGTWKRQYETFIVAVSSGITAYSQTLIFRWPVQARFSLLLRETGGMHGDNQGTLHWSGQKS